MCFPFVSSCSSALMLLMRIQLPATQSSNSSEEALIRSTSEEEKFVARLVRFMPGASGTRIHHYNSHSTATTRECERTAHSTAAHEHEHIRAHAQGLFAHTCTQNPEGVVLLRKAEVLSLNLFSLLLQRKLKRRLVKFFLRGDWMKGLG